MKPLRSKYLGFHIMPESADVESCHCCRAEGAGCWLSSLRLAWKIGVIKHLGMIDLWLTDEFIWPRPRSWQGPLGQVQQWRGGVFKLALSHRRPGLGRVKDTVVDHHSTGRPGGITAGHKVLHPAWAAAGSGWQLGPPRCEPESLVLPPFVTAAWGRKPRWLSMKECAQPEAWISIIISSRLR